MKTMIPSDHGVAPVQDALSAQWFEAAARGELLIQRDTATGIHYFYPRSRVPGTLTETLEWVTASGGGELYTYTVVHRTANSEFAQDLPYVLAIVKLDEGVHMSTRIVGVDHDQLRCGMRVQVQFDATISDIPLPVFTAATTEETPR